MKPIFTVLCGSLLFWGMSLQAQTVSVPLSGRQVMKLGAYPNGSVRVQVIPADSVDAPDALPQYVTPAHAAFRSQSQNGSLLTLTTPRMKVQVNTRSGKIQYFDAAGKRVLVEGVRQCALPYCSQQFETRPDEYLFGTGQFQDGNLNVKGLTRRLTQVNTQISLPMILSNAGYGIIWNNGGLTDFNPADHTLALQPVGLVGDAETVDATSTTGNRREERRYQTFQATLSVPASGDYALLLDVGQTMARKHHLSVDGTTVLDINNLWLPPTAALRLHLNKGNHTLQVLGEANDHPTIYWRRIDATTTFASPVSRGIDYTVMVGTPDEVVGQMRQNTGSVPMLPAWALGYVHCRERYVSQDDVLTNAMEFRHRNIPIDVIVQDWQWWGKHGWNAMRFDEDAYPDPKAMTDSLHRRDIRLMLSVWAKVDKKSELGKQMEAQGHYIPGTDWIDFFSPDAAAAYWDAYRTNLLPTGVDAWWQDATEPENDDLAGRVINRGRWQGDAYRNLFPLFVNTPIYNGLLRERPNQRPMILTRSAAIGIQRYGVFTWSGDVGNDWDTFARQIVGGLGQMAAGVPWWTYDAGGFFRPGNQYTDVDYQKRMLRWIQTSVFLPMMRVHGYMSKTEPWRYGEGETYEHFINSIRLRYSLLPYIYSEASRVWREDYTLMRPLVFDFPTDEEALRQTTEYAFGSQLLVCPITQPDVTTWSCYLPKSEGGWYDMLTSEYYPGGTYQQIPVSADRIPVFVRAGSILPRARVCGQTFSSKEVLNRKILRICVYPGADGHFTLYEDDGVSLDTTHSTIDFTWDDARQELIIGARQGSFPGMRQERKFNIAWPGCETLQVVYRGQEMRVSYAQAKRNH